MARSDAPTTRIRTSAVRAGLRTLLHEIDEALNLIAFSALQVAAALLPKRWVLGIADAIGVLAMLSPVGARLTRRMTAMFGAERAFTLARRRLTRPFRDHVIMVRFAMRREDVASWRIDSRNAPAMLRDPEASFIVAMGHFSREATIAAYLPSVVPHKLAAVMAPLHQVGLRGLRLHVQLGEMANALVQARNGDVEIVQTGRPGIMTQLVSHLKRPGGCVIISVDAPWPAGKRGIERAFAGRERQNYALGAARLSRLAQRPIVTCVPVLEAGQVVLTWGAPLAPAAATDQAADVGVTNVLLDELEGAIGLHPDQYVLSLGRTRRWNAATARWMFAPADAAAAPEPLAPHATAAE